MDVLECRIQAARRRRGGDSNCSGWSTAFRRPGPAEAGTRTSQIAIGKSLVTGLGCRHKRDHIDPPSALIEMDFPVDQRVNRPVPAHAYIPTRMPPASILAAQNAAGLGNLAAEE